MEPIAKLHRDFPRVVPMKTPEGLAIVEIHPAVGHVQGEQRYGKSLAEILTEGEIEGCVLWQVVTWIRLPRKGVAETRAVVNVG